MAKRQQWIQRESRSARWTDASVRSKRVAEAPAVITNISTRGGRIRSAAVFEAGELIQIVVPRLGLIAAQVRWSERGDLGAEFVVGSDSWDKPAPDRAAAEKAFREPPRSSGAI